MHPASPYHFGQLSGVAVMSVPRGTYVHPGGKGTIGPFEQGPVYPGLVGSHDVPAKAMPENPIILATTEPTINKRATFFILFFY